MTRCLFQDYKTDQAVTFWSENCQRIQVCPCMCILRVPSETELNQDSFLSFHLMLSHVNSIKCFFFSVMQLAVDWFIQEKRGLWVLVNRKPSLFVVKRPAISVNKGVATHRCSSTLSSKYGMQHLLANL